jgi:hypothetical protein
LVGRDNKVKPAFFAATPEKNIYERISRQNRLARLGVLRLVTITAHVSDCGTPIAPAARPFPRREIPKKIAAFFPT